MAGSTLRCQQTIHGFGFMSITGDKNHIGQRQGKALGARTVKNPSRVFIIH